MKNICFLIILLCLFIHGKSQHLSNLHATKNDPVFTTYAAPIEHSDYVLDQAYQFMWSNPQEPLGFSSQRAGSFFLAFEKGADIKWKAGDFYREAVITNSYSDLMQFNFYPFKDIRLDAFFDVYTSQSAIWEIQITNEGPFHEKLLLYAVFDGSSIEIDDLTMQQNAFTFSHKYQRDGWMIKHNIPLAENRKSCFSQHCLPYHKRTSKALKIFCSRERLSVEEEHPPEVKVRS
ncbi:MAG: hypothetical protein U5Q03_05325 [Bacteroidota bacterium]|nr:hypothetical protein [Bacteroidota bacterium]